MKIVNLCPMELAGVIYKARKMVFEQMQVKLTLDQVSIKLQ